MLEQHKKGRGNQIKAATIKTMAKIPKAMATFSPSLKFSVKSSPFAGLGGLGGSGTSTSMHVICMKHGVVSRAKDQDVMQMSKGFP